MPKIVVDDFGGTRSDPGMLGSGIYFASSSRLTSNELYHEIIIIVPCSVSSLYSRPGKTRGSRLMLLNQVALGNCMVCWYIDIFYVHTYNCIHNYILKF